VSGKPDIAVAVIGYSGVFNMGKWHLEEMRNAGMTPVAVADLDKERLRAAKRDFPSIKTYTSVSSMLSRSGCDLVTIITPQWARRPIHIIDLAYKSARIGRAVKATYG
jgi:predicted dehydrogenase